MNITSIETTDANGQQLLARTLYLLSRAATKGVCRGRMRAVIQHLTVASATPDLPESVRAMCIQLLADWRAAQADKFGSESPAAEQACHCVH